MSLGFVIPDSASAIFGAREHTGAVLQVLRAMKPSWPSRRLCTMLGFGFASGLPWPLSGLTLRQWMTDGHLPLAMIGATGSLGLSYSLKFLWAPLLDRACPGPWSGFGRRRGWLLIIQPALLIATAALALSNPARDITSVFLIAATVAFLSASQDVAIDAWRIESFPSAQQPAALAAYIWGYRVALLAGGAGAIALASPLGWHRAILAVSAMGLIGLVSTLVASEPTRSEVCRGLDCSWRDRFQSAVVMPIGEFLARPGSKAVVAYVMLFKLGEAMAAVMVFPLYHALGFTREAVAVVQGPLALTATLCGFLVGGGIVGRIDLGRALIVTGFGQMLVMALYIVLALSPNSQVMLVATSIAESFVEGVADAAFLTFLSALCTPAYTATQYSLLSSAAALPLRTVGGISGKLAAATGFPTFYSITSLASLPAMLVMLIIVKRWPAAIQRQGPSAIG